MKNIKSMAIPELYELIKDNNERILSDPKKLNRVLQAMARNEELSAENIILIYMQQPGLLGRMSEIAGYYSWKQQGREVTSLPIYIMSPAVKKMPKGTAIDLVLVPVFDRTQTTGTERKNYGQPIVGKVLPAFKSITNVSVIPDSEEFRYDKENQTLFITGDKRNDNKKIIYELVKAHGEYSQMFSNPLEFELAVDYAANALITITNAAGIKQLQPLDDNLLPLTRDGKLEFINKVQKLIRISKNSIEENYGSLSFDEISILNEMMQKEREGTMFALTKAIRTGQIVWPSLLEAVESVMQKLGGISDNLYNEIYQDKINCKIICSPKYKINFSKDREYLKAGPY